MAIFVNKETAFLLAAKLFVRSGLNVRMEHVYQLQAIVELIKIAHPTNFVLLETVLIDVHQSNVLLVPIVRMETVKLILMYVQLMPHMRHLFAQNQGQLRKLAQCFIT